MLHIEQLVGNTAGTAASSLQLTSERRQWLDSLDLDPATLLAYLSMRPTHRLGVYFEQLWHFFLQHDPDIELLAHNLPVHAEGRTLGEFDCIYYSKQRDCHVHLELAVKYFLGLPRSSGSITSANAQEWLGPDQRDRLATKLDQLLHRQILLGDAPAAKEILQNLGVDALTREIALKGYLFQPQCDAPPPPPGFNRACNLSYWITYDEVAAHNATLTAAAFAILPKMRWLSPAHCKQSGESLSQAELLLRITQLLENDHYPLLIAALDSNGEESSRFFVTPGHWPDSSEQ